MRIKIRKRPIGAQAQAGALTASLRSSALLVGSLTLAVVLAAPGQADPPPGEHSHSHAHDDHSHAHGDDGHAHGDDGHAHGDSDHAHGDDGHAYGDSDHAQGDDGHAHGDDNHAHGDDGHAHGDGDHAHGDDDHAHGNGDHAHGNDDHAHGDGDHVHGDGDGDHAHGNDGHAHGDDGHAHGDDGHAHGDDGHAHGDDDHAHGDGGHGWQAPQEWVERVNPLEPDAETLAYGQQVYQRYCSACHGLEGAGDGPAAAIAGFDPSPTNLVLHGAAHGAGEYAWLIKEGGHTSAMPRYLDKLDDEAVWSVVHYIRHELAGDHGDHASHQH
ncbi:c-type cytochrome [Halomonas campisalis]|uniref:C-type cytochrome n=1 Tax=Billgrantia campisalis TaxID=74661 RepID=A0ABS9P6P1_9GAMM|nr:c-type cytochrome [Halomonas campisalis]MCG6657454.1 c-type cytochrome [Halomonas campisalis]MDR5863200.1 c-type cytochrome [Halomonas campisalis]